MLLTRYTGDATFLPESAGLTSIHTHDWRAVRLVGHGLWTKGLSYNPLHLQSLPGEIGTPALPGLLARDGVSG